jgi:hypothetical protein
MSQDLASFEHAIENESQTLSRSHYDGDKYPEIEEEAPMTVLKIKYGLQHDTN